MRYDGRMNRALGRRWQLLIWIVVGVVCTLLAIGAVTLAVRTIALEGELARVSADITELREATTDTFAALGVLLERQADDLSRQDEALRQAQEQEAALQSALDEVREAQARPLAQGLEQSLFREIAQSVVQVRCRMDAGGNRMQRGTGILLSDGRTQYVQTSLHVVATDDGAESRCTVTLFPDYRDPSSALVFQSQGHGHHREDVDIAFITPVEVSGSAGTSADLARYARSVTASPVCAADTGDRISILGYPSSGGDTLTITDGIISGVEFEGEVRYLKTSAKIDTGNSGGVALKDSGCIVGIPTSVRRGTLENIGRILDLDYLNRSIL